MSNLARISISLEKDLLARFDRFAAQEGYPTRSEGLKALMRNNLVQDQWTRDTSVAGAVTLVYDHHHRSIVAKITDVQHDFSSVIVSAQHVHLDHDHCLEIIVVKGRVPHIRKLVAALKATKGLKHSSLVMTSID
jgi:CopG family transcriptional regulator, nickel-responsive regulator